VKVALLVVTLALGAWSASGADLWVLYGSAQTPARLRCSAVGWHADAALHNLSSAPVTVRLAGVSNGGGASAPAQDVIRSGGTLSLSRSPVRGLANTRLWMSHLDVPDGIIGEGRLELFQVDTCSPGRPPGPLPFGRLTFPVFHALAPAGYVQTHFGTDLGAQSARVNIGIYNAGAVPATAIVTLNKPACPAGNVTSLVVIPADTVIQTPLAQVVTCPGGRTDPQVTEWISYISVVVDQPSLSFVSTLSNEADPWPTASVATEDIVLPMTARP